MALPNASDVRASAVHAAGDSQPDGRSAGLPASRTENLLVMFGGIWLIVGLFIDGYAHSEIIDTETEDFFTVWHGIFYSGFLFVLLTVSWIVVRRSDDGPARSWIPAGYGLAIVGLAVFTVGGIGDAIWHTVFGVCLLYTSPSPRDATLSRMPSSA